MCPCVFDDIVGLTTALLVENRRIYPETSRSNESCVMKREIKKRSFLDGFR